MDGHGRLEAFADVDGNSMDDISKAISELISPTAIESLLRIAIIVIALYGGALWGILPTAWGVSWEMHLFGFIAGIVAARVLPTDQDD